MSGGGENPKIKENYSVNPTQDKHWRKEQKPGNIDITAIKCMFMGFIVGYCTGQVFITSNRFMDQYLREYRYFMTVEASMNCPDRLKVCAIVVIRRFSSFSGMP